MTTNSPERELVKQKFARFPDKCLLPLWRERIEFVEKQNTWLGCYGSGEDITDLNHVDLACCCWIDVRSLTDFSLAPMYLFKSSGPLTLIKCSPHSFATAEARRVLPQPG